MSIHHTRFCGELKKIQNPPYLFHCIPGLFKFCNLRSLSSFFLCILSTSRLACEPISGWNRNEPPRDKTNNVAVHPAKTQISLGICPVWSESSLCAQWVVKDPSFLHADSEDSDQTGRMPKLIWVFAGHTLTLLVLSQGGSNDVSCPNHFGTLLIGFAYSHSMMTLFGEERAGWLTVFDLNSTHALISAPAVLIWIHGFGWD